MCVLLQEASKALEIGSSVLLPPVLDRMDLLLAILPESPPQLTSLSAGQVCVCCSNVACSTPRGSRVRVIALNYGGITHKSHAISSA